MALFDPRMFDPDYYQGGILGNGAGLVPQQPAQSRGYPSDTPISDWLQQLLTGGSPAQPQQQPTPFPAQGNAAPVPMAGMMSPQGTLGFGGQPPQPQQPPVAQAPQMPPLNPNMTSNAPSDIGFQYGPGGQQAWQQAGAQGALPPNAQPTQFQPQQQAPSSGGSFLDRIATGANNFATAPSFLGGLAEGARGIASGRDSNSTLQKTGADPFTGQDTFAWANPRNQSMATATVGAAPGAAPAATQGQSLGAFSEAVKSGVSGEKLYDYLPATMKNTVKSMIEGRMQPPAGAAMRSPQTMALIQAANAIDPQFDAANWGVRSALTKNYMAGGKQFQEIQAIGTVAGHLDNLAKSADGLGNTDYPIVNGVVNWFKENTGNPAIDKFKTDLHAVSNELSKAYRGGHVTEGDVKSWNDSINAAKSTGQLRSVIGEMNDLLRSKREAVEQGYRSGMGGIPLPQDFTSESDKSRKSFDRVARWANGETQPGSVAPAAQTAINPKTGQRIMLKGGQWVPVQ